MRPETNRELDRMLRRQRLRTWVVGLAAGLPILALLVIFAAPHEAGPTMSMRLQGFETVPSDDGNNVRLVLERQDGRTIRLAAVPGEARLQLGDTVCLVEMRQYMTGRIRYNRVPPARCAPSE